MTLWGIYQIIDGRDLNDLASHIDAQFKEYNARIDTRFQEFEVKIDKKLDTRFEEFSVTIDKKLDTQFEEFAILVNKGFTGTQQYIDGRLDRVEEILKDIVEEVSQTHADVTYLRNTTDV